MLQFLLKLFRSPLFKLVIKIIASLASAILVVSGVILFRTKKGELEENGNGGEVLNGNEDPKNKKASVHFLHKGNQSKEQ